jgi:hypothetical protein
MMFKNFSYTEIVASYAAILSTILLLKDLYLIYASGAKPRLEVQKANRPNQVTLIVTNKGKTSFSISALEVRLVRRRLLRPATIIKSARFDSATPFSPVINLAPDQLARWPLKLFDRHADDADGRFEFLLFHNRAKAPYCTIWQSGKVA